jgi:pyruvate dehydrogenase complex dihydrolipoamide acetyltransferase long form
MSFEFKVPELGENIHGGDVVNVLVREGQVITANQALLELETDKAVIELPCPQGGKITQLHVKKGDSVKVGQPLVTLEVAAGAAPPAAVVAPSPAPAPATTAASSAAVVSSAPPPAAPTRPAASTALAPATAPGMAGPIPAGPAVRRMAREAGVDLGAISGSGPHGRILPEDIPSSGAAAPAAPAPAAPRAATAATVWSSEPVVPPGELGQDSWGPVRREKMSQIRRTIAAHMSKSATTIPHVTNFDDADVTDLDVFRKSVPPGYLGANVKLTMMPCVMKAVAIALRRHPVLNATVDEENGQMVYKQYVHLGVAVDTPRGLVVPVMQNVDRMRIPEIARSLMTIAERARQVQFTIEELRGGTFTLSNLGAVGGSYSTPIINYPEVAVLLLGRSRWLPMVREGEIEPRLMMPLSLSYDHRVVDGAAAARFLTEVIDYLQSPGKLLLAER